MHSRQRSVAVLVTSVIVTFAVAGMVVAATSFSGQGTVAFDSIRVGAQGVGGVTFFNGSIVNQTTGAGGSDNPVTFADNIRVDGRVYRGSSQGPADASPFIIDDNAQITGNLVVTGSLSAGSITGLSELVGAVVTSANSGYAKTTDITNLQGSVGGLQDQINGLSGRADKIALDASNAQSSADAAKTAADTAQSAAGAAQTSADDAQAAAEAAQGTADWAEYSSYLNFGVLSCLDILGDTFDVVLYVDVQFCYDEYWGSSSVAGPTGMWDTVENRNPDGTEHGRIGGFIENQVLEGRATQQD